MTHTPLPYSLLAARALLGMMLSLPFLQPVHSLPLPSFYSEWLAVLLGLLASVLSLPTVFSGKLNTLRLPLILSLPLALLTVVLLQAVGGQFAYLSSAVMVMAILLWVGCVMFAASVMVQLSSAASLLCYLAKWLMFAAVLNALFGVLQSLGAAPYLPGLVIESQPGSGVWGNLAQQNHFASYLACGLAATLYLHQQRQLPRYSVGLIVGVLLLGLLLSGSRSVIFYLLACGFWLGKGWLSWSRFAQVHWRSAGWGLAAVLLVLSLLMFGSDWGSAQLQRYAYWSETIGARAFLWKHAVQMWLQAPWMGVGWDNFAYQLVEQIGEAKQVNRWGVDQYAHNFLLQLAAVAGLLGVLAVLVPVGGLLRRLWRAGVLAHQCFPLAVLSILLIHSSLEQPLYYCYFLGLAACMLVCVESAFWTLSLAFTKWFAALFLLCAVIASVQTVVDYRILDQHFVGERELTEEQVWVLHERSLFPAIVETIFPQLFVPHSASAQEKLVLNTRLLHHAPLADTEFRQAALLAEAGQMDAATRRLTIAAYAYPAQLEMYAQRFAILAQNEPEKYAKLAQTAQELMLVIL